MNKEKQNVALVIFAVLLLIVVSIFVSYKNITSHSDFNSAFKEDITRSMLDKTGFEKDAIKSYSDCVFDLHKFEQGGFKENVKYLTGEINQTCAISANEYSKLMNPGVETPFKLVVTNWLNTPKISSRTVVACHALLDATYGKSSLSCKEVEKLLIKGI